MSSSEHSRFVKRTCLMEGTRLAQMWLFSASKIHSANSKLSRSSARDKASVQESRILSTELTRPPKLRTPVAQFGPLDLAGELSAHSLNPLPSVPQWPHRERGADGNGGVSLCREVVSFGCKVVLYLFVSTDRRTISICSPKRGIMWRRWTNTLFRKPFVYTILIFLPYCFCPPPPVDYSCTPSIFAPAICAPPK
jgi:hypothetical protein